MYLTLEPIKPVGVAAEDWNVCNGEYCRAALLDPSLISDYETLPFWQVIPYRDQDRKAKGYRHVPSDGVGLTNFQRNHFYAHYILPDGRIARWNSWMTELTVYPIRNKYAKNHKG